MSSAENKIPAADGLGGPSDRPAGLTARERSRRRKAIYILAIILLMFGLVALSRPATRRTKADSAKPGAAQTVTDHAGGVLAQYREKNGLSQTELGEVDPTSETVRLATLGMRGVGSSVLWWTACQQQMKKDWTQLRATLDQISKLQPHSIAVWRYQAWNLSYNVSVAFDDYHDKFYWVVEGLNFMLDGIDHNDKEPRLYWDMAWFISNKIGRADEAKYYRRLFAGKKDVSEKLADFRHDSALDDSGRDYAPDYVKDFLEEYPKRLPADVVPLGCNLRDNWHLGKAWFLAAESKIDPPRYPVRGMAEVIFYSDAPTCQFYYADNLEKDGRFDQVAVEAWKQASREWHAFGERPIDTSYDIPMQLNRLEEIQAGIDKTVAQLDALVPGERENLKREKLNSLKKDDPDAWNALQVPEGKRTPQQSTLVDQAKEKLEVKDDEVAHRAPPSKLKEANRLADKIQADRELAREMSIERSKVNFDFWRTRAEAESTDECVAARRAIQDGDDAFAKGDQIRALPFYEKGMRGWRKVLDKYPTLVADPSLGGDLLDVVHRYQKALDQDDRDLPKNFPLQDIVKAHEPGGGSEQQK